MKNEAWILGASGRTAQPIAHNLAAAGVPVVLVGRDRGRLESLAAGLAGPSRILVGTLEQNLAKLAGDQPGVVVNTVGPFTATAARVASALPRGTHYVDISNEFGPVEAILAMDATAKSEGQTLVAAAGFGVLATEAVVIRLCEGMPRPKSVRVDAMAAVAMTSGTVGAALAGTIAEVAAFGGREVRGGRVVRSRTGAGFERLTTPDGNVLGTGAGATGDLLSAWKASGADSVVAASTAIPANGAVRAVLPVLGGLFQVPALKRFAARQLANVKTKPQAMSRTASWGHARVEWADGTAREGWLRIGEGVGFTAGVTAEVARRLLAGEGRPGAFTPGALFGAELAEDLGATFELT